MTTPVSAIGWLYVLGALVTIGGLLTARARTTRRRGVTRAGLAMLAVAMLLRVVFAGHGKTLSMTRGSSSSAPFLDRLLPEDDVAVTSARAVIMTGHAPRERHEEPRADPEARVRDDERRRGQHPLAHRHDHPGRAGRRRVRHPRGVGPRARRAHGRPLPPRLRGQLHAPVLDGGPGVAALGRGHVLPVHADGGRLVEPARAGDRPQDARPPPGARLRHHRPRRSLERRRRREPPRSAPARPHRRALAHLRRRARRVARGRPDPGARGLARHDDEPAGHAALRAAERRHLPGARRHPLPPHREAGCDDRHDGEVARVADAASR